MRLAVEVRAAFLRARRTLDGSRRQEADLSDSRQIAKRNTDRLEAEEGAGLVQQALQHPRFRSTEASRLTMRDMSLVTQPRAMLVADPVTSRRSISVDCSDGVVSLGGRVEEWSVRRAAEQVNNVLAAVVGAGEDSWPHPGGAL